MRDALFMGRMTASATHELQNILATIRESSGLMDDLLAMSSEGFAHAERFKKGLTVLAEQVERGMILTEHTVQMLPPAALQGYVGQLPLPRGGSPAEAALAYAYLMLNTYATGQIVPVDGGGLLV